MINVTNNKKILFKKLFIFHSNKRKVLFLFLFQYSVDSLKMIGHAETIPGNILKIDFPRFEFNEK